MPEAVAPVAGSALSFIGGRGQQREARRLQEQARRDAVLRDFSVGGFGGAGARLEGGNIMFDEGQFGPLIQQLFGAAGQGIDQASNTGLPGNVTGANQLFQQALGQAQGSAFGGLNELEATAGNALGRTFSDFGSRLGSGFQTGLQDAAFGAAGAQFGDLAQTGSEARDAALSNFRQQALPGQERAVNSTLTNLFSSGRLGTSGGANVIGRLAEAQNQQDLGFQQAAFGEGRAAQQNALGIAQGATGIGSGLRSQQESLLQNAFGRFAQTQGLASDLSNQRFGQGLSLANLANQNLTAQGGIAQLEQALRGGNLGFALQALQGQSGIQDQLLGLFGAGLQTENAALAGRIGGNTQVANLASQSNFGGNSLGNFGSAILQNSEGIGNTLSGFFNRNSGVVKPPEGFIGP